MKSVMIERRFCGPPNSANGGYVCGLLARHIDGDAEITLLAPPPLDQRLDLVASEQGVELRKGEIALARGRSVLIDLPEIPVISYAAAEDAVGRSPYDESRHPLPTCFVCGPARARGDGLRLIPGPLQRPLPAYSCEAIGTVAAPWVPYPDLAGEDGAVDSEFVWAALDCPTGFAGVGAQHLGMTGAETILLGRMSGRINRRPRPGDECVIVAWPTGRDGRKLFADGALLGPDGEILAVARATWLLVDRKVQLGEKATA